MAFLRPVLADECPLVWSSKMLKITGPAAHGKKTLRQKLVAGRDMGPPGACQRANLSRIS
jgi:hypothetical protein